MSQRMTLMGYLQFALGVLFVAVDCNTALAQAPMQRTVLLDSTNSWTAKPLDQQARTDPFRRIGTTRFRTGDGVLALAYSQDGKLLASGGRNDAVRIWNAQSGEQFGLIQEHWVWALAFSPDGKLLATGGANKVVRVWEIATGKEVKKLVGHQATIKALAFSDDGNAVISSGDDQSVRLWNVTDGAEIAKHSGHSFAVTAALFLPGKNRFASASTDRTIRLWDSTAKSVVIAAPAGVNALAYLPGRKTLVAGCDDGFIREWNLSDAKLAREWQAHPQGVTHLVVPHDGGLVATCGRDQFIRLWDIAKGTELRKLVRHVGDGDALAISPDGKFVAAGGANNSIRCWNTANGQEVHPTSTPAAPIVALALSPGGNRGVVGFATGDVLEFKDMLAGMEGGRWGGADVGEFLLAFSAAGKTWAVASANAGVEVFEPPAHRQLGLPLGDEIRCLALSSGGQKLAVGYANAGVRIWNVEKNNLHKHIPAGGGIRTIAFSPDGKRLAVALDESIAVHEGDSFQIVRQFSKLNDTPACLEFSPDGRTLAAGMFSGLIQLFDLTVAKDRSDLPPRTLEGHRGMVHALGWSVNGRCLASAGYDKSVRLWEFVNGLPIRDWQGHSGEVTVLAFHPLSRIVVSGSKDTGVLLWEVTGFGLEGKLPAPKKLEAAELDKLWMEMTSEENRAGNEAMWAMAAAPEPAAYLSKKVFLTDPKIIKQNIDNLDSDVFKVREKAFSTLAQHGRWIEGVLRRALDQPQSEEARRRLTLLLQRLAAADSVTLQQERLRARRVIEVLEQTPTPAALKLLRDLAAGAAEEDLRDMAQAALARVSAR